MVAKSVPSSINVEAFSGLNFYIIRDFFGGLTYQARSLLEVFAIFYTCKGFLAIYLTNRLMSDDNSRTHDIECGVVVEPVNAMGKNSCLKYTSLVLLTFQNATLALMMRYVRTRPGSLFLASTAVVSSEVLKLVICFAYVLVEQRSLTGFVHHLRDNIVRQPMDCVKVSIPAVIYIVTNNLLYVASSNLDAASQQITYQLKIFTTAIFSVLMLKKKLSVLQWISLFLLCAGVVCVQLQPTTTDDVKDASAINLSKPIQRPWVGFLAGVIACILTGFAGIYFEKILKSTPQSIFVRNIQLGVIGIFAGLLGVLISDGGAVEENGFFFGYDVLVLVVVAIHGIGGILVAAVQKYADNILKGFAASGAIVIAAAISIFMLDFQLSVEFVVGAIAVIAAIFMYSGGESMAALLPVCCVAL